MKMLRLGLNKHGPWATVDMNHLIWTGKAIMTLLDKLFKISVPVDRMHTAALMALARAASAIKKVSHDKV